MPKVIKHIKTTISRADLANFLLELYGSANVNERLLCLCLLIELKYGLIKEGDLLSQLDDFLIKSIPLDYITFTGHRAPCFTNPYYGKKVRYSRVIDKVTFDNFNGSYRYRRPMIDKSKIAMNGWSTRNGIVWVTPKDGIDKIWSAAKGTLFSADKICDHLGFPRNEPVKEFVKVNYSDNFPDITYQPNSSNRLWIYEYNLFLSIKWSEFGLTYNENNIPEAKEHIHERSVYYDDEFSVESIGQSSVKFPINDKIIEAAKIRLDI